MNPVPATLEKLPARILGGGGVLRTSEWASTALAKLQGAILDLLVATHCPHSTTCGSIRNYRSTAA